MEDAHISCICEDGYIFAVFDGHGGPEVAKFCSLKFVDIFKSTEEYKEGKWGKGLEKAFILMDDLLRKPKS